MPPGPERLASLSAAKLGATYEVEWKAGAWSAGKVVDERGEGKDRQVKVHYIGYKKRWDEWITTAQKLKKVRSGPESLMEKARQIHGGTQGAVVHEDEVCTL